MSITTQWDCPPKNFINCLNPGTVHVWRAPLDDSTARASQFRQHLSKDERLRADQCRAPHPQYQFVITRSILRILLSRYLGVLPTHIEFDTLPSGKPLLRQPSLQPIQFNVSHTQGMAMIAMTLQHAIGIDVEWINRKIQHDDIAKRFFSTKESEHLASLSEPERLLQFFLYWTCKEAYLKMQGRGITQGLAQGEMTFHAQESRVEYSNLAQQTGEEDCSIYRMTGGAEHVGAVAVATFPTQISYWNWKDEYLS